MPAGIIAEHLHLAYDEGHWVEVLRDLARKYAIDIVAGTIVEKSRQNDEHLFNTSVLIPHPGVSAGQLMCGPDVFRARYIDKHGEILGEYRKKNLWYVHIMIQVSVS